MAAAGRRLTFVLAFQPGPGHWSRMSPIASALGQAGHRVVLATSDAFRRRLGEISRDDFIAVGPSWEEDRLMPGDARRRRSLVGELRSRSATISAFFFGAARQVSLDLVRGLKRISRPDLLVFDYTLLGGPPTAEALGLPWASVFGLTVPFSVAGWPPFGSHFRFASSVSARRRYRAIDESIRLENRQLYGPVRALWRAAGRAAADPWRPYARLGQIGIVGSIPECEFPLPARFPGQIHYVGPFIGDGGAAAGLDREALAFVHRKHDGPLVHVTLGMTFSRTAPVLERIAGALGDERVRLLISSGRLDPQSVQSAFPPAAARLLVRQTVPHLAVMPEVDALICHGGAGTLMKALYFGVPVLVVPLGAEQRSNGARFVHARIGKMILPRRLTGNGVRDALRSLIDPAGGHRRAAREMGEKARRAGGAEHAASLLEEVCRRRTAS